MSPTFTLSSFLTKKIGGKLIPENRWKPDRKFKIECGKLVPSAESLMRLIREHYKEKSVNVVFDEHVELSATFKLDGERYWLLITPVYRNNPPCILGNVTPL